MNQNALYDTFACTYSPPNGLDPIELCEEYEQFVTYRADNPNAGRYKTANELDIPKVRARSWIDGGKPDVVRGAEIGENHGWFRTTVNTHIVCTRLVAGIFAAGSINQNWTPRWSATDDVDIKSHLQTISTGVDRITRANPQQGDELEPASYPRVLGRVLVARGAPREHVSNYELSSYLLSDPEAGCAFVETYIAARGVIPDGRKHIQILEQQRSEEFHNDLHTLIVQHVNGDVSLGKHGVRIPPETVEQTAWLDELTQ